MHQSLFLYPIKDYTQGAKTVCKISKFENPLTHLVGFATEALQEWDERESPPRFSKMRPKLFKSITKQCISIEYATILPFEQKKMWPKSFFGNDPPTGGSTQINRLVRTTANVPNSPHSERKHV